MESCHAHFQALSCVKNLLPYMSAYAESHASFKHRAIEIGLSVGEVTNLTDQNIKSFNNLAFAVCGQPGQLDDARFRQLADAAFDHPNLGLESMLRQLSYEAITVAVAAIRPTS